MTKRWCSPEVAAQHPRGRAADIFSLGCVFLEMYTVLVGQRSADFEEFRAQDGNGDAFHLTLSRVRQWMQKLQNKLEQGDRRNKKPPNLFLDLVSDMIAEDPKRRPTSAEVATRLETMTIYGLGCNYKWQDYGWQCCSLCPESYRVAEEDVIYDYFSFGV